MLLQDTKIQWLLLAAILVSIFEVFSLVGIKLNPYIAIPLYLSIIVVIGYQTLYHGFQALIRFNLKSIKLIMLLAVIGAFCLGKYEEAAVVIVLYTLAEKLEDLGIAKSKSALSSLLAKMPKEVTLKDRKESVPLSEVIVGDIFLIKPGEMIALDGTVIKGSSSVDESTITGEPIPQDKHPGDQVFAGTLNHQGFLEITVTKIAVDSTVAKINELTYQATKNKAKTQQFIETFSSYYTPTVLLIAVIILLYPTLILGKSFNLWLLEALSLLVIACPCALVISTPISIYSAIGNASANGILIKGGRFLEALGQVKAMAFDKTRTLTIGKPFVTDIIPFGTSTREDLLSCAAGLELFSEHPLSQSIVDAAQQENFVPHEVESFQSIVGKGVKAECLVCEDAHHCIGKLQFILEEHEVPEKVLQQVIKLQKEGKTVVVVSTHKEVEGIIAFSDALRQRSTDLISEIHGMGIHTAILTGDHQISAQVISDELKIKEVYADLLPEGKAIVMGELLKKYGTVGMVGDGVNDAPALALSSVGITMSGLGSDVAIDAASVIILNDRIDKIPDLIRLAKRALRTIRVNTVLAILVKVIFILLAIVGRSNLVMAIFADVGVTVLVIFNSLRLMSGKKEEI